MKKGGDYLTSREAAEMAGVTTATIRNWIETYDIGIMIGGRYRISRKVLTKIMDGESKEIKEEKENGKT
jgi:excisionase family DNA binding protein